MKKLFFLLVSALFILSAGCGGGGGGGSSSSSNNSDTSEVTIRLGESQVFAPDFMKNDSVIPPYVVDIRIIISAQDIATITKVFPVSSETVSFEETFIVRNGPNRKFEIEARDKSGNILYKGVRTIDLTGKPVTLVITLKKRCELTCSPEFAGVSEIDQNSITENSMKLVWQPATDNVTPQAEIQYLVFMANTCDELNSLTPDSQPTFTTDPGVTEYTVTGLEPDTFYCFVVRARDGFGNTDSNFIQMSAKTLKTLDLDPPDFGGLGCAAPLSEEAIRLTWSPATDILTSAEKIKYNIYISTAPLGQNFGVPNITTPPGVTSYDVTGLSPGTTYYFIVRAVDDYGNEDDNTAEFSATSLVACLFVDVTNGMNNSDCKSSQTACKTISYALTQTPGNENICISAGNYNSLSGETFPLELKQGTTLFCTGSNHSTIIGGTGVLTVFGAPDASIKGCTVIGSPAITDNGTTITVDDSVIDGAGSLSTGISLLSASTVKNSIVQNYRAEDGVGINIIGGNPTLSGNDIKNNQNGVNILGGNPVLSNNAIRNNIRHGINISDGSPNLSNNAIYNAAAAGSPSTPVTSSGLYISGGAPILVSNDIYENINGLEITGGFPTLSGNAIYSNRDNGIAITAGSLTLSGNTIRGNDGDGVTISGGSPVVLIGNTISYNSAFGIRVDSVNATIKGNRIRNNVFGGIKLRKSNSEISGNTIIGNPGITTISLNDINNLGTGIYNHQSSPEIMNNSITSNITGVFINDSDFGQQLMNSYYEVTGNDNYYGIVANPPTTYSDPDLNDNTLACNYGADLVVGQFSSGPGPQVPQVLQLDPLNAANNEWDNSPPLIGQKNVLTVNDIGAGYQQCASDTNLDVCKITYDDEPYSSFYISTIGSSVLPLDECPQEIECFDNADNDADGLTDCEDPDCTSAVSDSECVAGLGICEFGILHCQGGAEVCTPFNKPQMEICGNIYDENCDGVVAECPSGDSGEACPS